MQPSMYRLRLVARAKLGQAMGRKPGKTPQHVRADQQDATNDRTCPAHRTWAIKAHLRPNELSYRGLERCFRVAVVLPRLALREQGGTVVIVYRRGSRPTRTCLQCSGIDTGAPGRTRGDSGATAVDILSLR